MVITLLRASQISEGLIGSVVGKLPSLQVIHLWHNWEKHVGKLKRVNVYIFADSNLIKIVVDSVSVLLVGWTTLGDVPVGEKITQKVYKTIVTEYKMSDLPLLV